MMTSVKRRLLCGVAAAVLSGATPAFANILGIQGVDFTLEGGYLLGSGKLPYAEYNDLVVPAHDFAMKPGNAGEGGLAISGKLMGGWSINLAYKGI